MVTIQTVPELDSRNEQDERQRSSPNRRFRGFGVAAVIVVIASMAGVACSDDGDGAPPPTEATESTETPQTRFSIVDVGSGTVTAFTAPAGASDFEFTLDGSMITFSDLDENGDAQVFVMDADGSNAKQVTDGDGGVGDYGGPSWSPDGSMIAYQRDTSDDPQIFVVRVSDGVSDQVTMEAQGAVDPGGWAPDGGSIVFSTLDPSISHYTARSVDLATGQTRLIVADGSTPELSPDGAWIAFNSWLKPDPLVRLMLANSDGSERRVIARLNGDDGYERWSPDSTQIAYLGSTDEDGFGTYVYDLATGETRFVTDGTIDCWIDDDHILVS